MVCNPVITVLWLNSGLFSLHQREDGEQLALQSSLSCLPACLPFLLILCLWLSLLVKNTLTPIHQKQNRNECVCAHYWHVIIRSDGGQTICKKQECACINTNMLEMGEYVTVNICILLTFLHLRCTVRQLNVFRFWYLQVLLTMYCNDMWRSQPYWGI